MSNDNNFSLNLGTLGPQHSFSDTLDAALKHGFRTVSPWRHHYQTIGVEAAAKELTVRGMKVDTVCRISGFGSATDNQQWSQALDEAKAVIEETAILGARGFVYPGGGLGVGNRSIKEARKRVADGLAQIAPISRQAGVLALVEPLHPMVAADRGAINTLASALDLCEGVGEGTGLVVDSYNVWWDPELEASLERAGSRVSGFQVSDWLMTTRHTAFDRGMVGDGVIDFAQMRKLVDRTGYTGPIELEVLSEQDWWTRDLDDVLSIAYSRMVEHFINE